MTYHQGHIMCPWHHFTI